MHDSYCVLIQYSYCDFVFHTRLYQYNIVQCSPFPFPLSLWVLYNLNDTYIPRYYHNTTRVLLSTELRLADRGLQRGNPSASYSTLMASSCCTTPVQAALLTCTSSSL
jgi:hypothetical protein